LLDINFDHKQEIKYKMKNYLPIIVCCALFCSTNVYPQKYDEFIDKRDNQTYKIVKVGDQVWMAENMNYKMGVSWCFVNEESYCDTYGRLYDWYTATKVCPAGWHLPTDKEYIITQIMLISDIMKKVLFFGHLLKRDIVLAILFN